MRAISEQKKQQKKNNPIIRPKEKKK